MKNSYRFLLTYFLVACCSLIFAQAPPPAPTPLSPAAELVKQGRQLNNEGKQDEALAKFAEAMKLDPTLADAHLAAGAALDLKGQYKEAREHFAKAIELSKPEAKAGALRNMAFSYAFENKATDAAKYEQQIFDVRIAASDFTGAAEIANELARIYLESGDVNDAEKWYKSGFESAMRKGGLKPADQALWEFRWEHAQARIAARRGKKEDAVKHVAAAKAALDRAANPDQMRFFPYLTGYVAYYAGDYKAAIDELLKADQKDPFILVLLAQAYEKSGDRTTAMDYYRKVMASNAHNPTNAFARPIARQKLAEAGK